MNSLTRCDWLHLTHTHARTHTQKDTHIEGKEVAEKLLTQSVPRPNKYLLISLVSLAGVGD